ncbi:Transient receptor potential (TRP) ion channel [Microdochium nivale]|nr:Transient receptor potential (TRP) ion channel [Microdochium nivale]
MMLSRWLRTAVTALALVAATLRTANGAYVQSVPCLGDFPQQHFLGPTGVTARLEYLNKTHGRLTLDLRSELITGGCDHVGTRLPAIAVRLATLGRDDAVSYHDVNTTCHKDSQQAYNNTITLQNDYPTFADLATFQLAVQFLHDRRANTVEACVRLRATPQPSVLLKALLRYVPMAILTLVITTGIIRSIPSTRVQPRSRVGNDNTEEEDVVPQPILPNVGDCLQYLQFVFLTACLSVQYPGFYQPAISELRWYSFFGTSLWTNTGTYDGYVDGIYAINGTFGGTYGTELMTQVVGAPFTRWTWINMVLCLAIAAAALTLLLWMFWLLEIRKAVLGIPDLGRPGWKPLASNVVKAILSYFMLPVTTLTVYQFDYASQLPISHSVFAVFILAALIAAFAWLVWQIPTRSLGALLFDPSRRYERIQQQPSSPDGVMGRRRNTNDTEAEAIMQAEQRHDRIFVYTLFLTMFIRAAIIGGLQLSGVAQVIALFCCEMLFAAYIVGMQAYPLVSLGSFAAGVRVVTLAAMIAFLPDMISDGPRDMVAYGILGLQAAFLVFGFGASAAYHLVDAVVKRARSVPGNEIYGLRDLQRRPDSQNALGITADLPHDSNRDLYSPHPGTRLSLPSIGGSDSTVSLPATLRGQRAATVANIGAPLGSPLGSPTSRTASPSERRLDSLRSDDPRASYSGSASGANYFFRPPRSSTYSPSPSLRSSRPDHLRSQPRLNHTSKVIPSLRLSPSDSFVGTDDTGTTRHSVAAVPTLGAQHYPRAGSKHRLYGHSTNSNSNTTSPSSSIKRTNRGAIHHALPSPHTLRDKRSSIRFVSAQDQEDLEDKSKQHTGDHTENIDNQAAAGSRSSSALGPRWNDYSFREADLIYGGPEEGEYEAARAHYGQASVPETAGRSSTTTMGTTSTFNSSSTTASGSKSAGDDDDDADGRTSRISRISDDNFKAGDSLSRNAGGTGPKKSRFLQLREFSSSRLLSVVGQRDDRDAAAGAASEAAEQGFSVRRPPRPPEHVVRAIEAAVRAQQAEERRVEPEPGEETKGEEVRKVTI